ncbi:MAG: hypothetical protein HYU36_06095 [Planctomycetes bacterium]|nr:hypothetical protein [Planctomycetota bacterium]
MDEQSRLDLGEDLALEAGRTARRFYQQSELRVDLKPDQSLLSEADAAVEEHITRRLRQDCAGEPIIGEEAAGDTGPECFSRALLADHAWVVDPIDGTNNFVAGHPVWCVSIAHLERGHPVLGVNYFPALNGELYFNEGQQLLLRRDADRETSPAQAVPARSAATEHSPLFMAYDSFFYRYRLTRPHVPRISGCTVWNLLAVVLGRAWGAATSAHLWDVAAPMAYAPARGVQMVAASSGLAIESFVPECFHLTPDRPQEAWKLKELHLIAPADRVGEIRGCLVQLGPRGPE